MANNLQFQANNEQIMFEIKNKYFFRLVPLRFDKVKNSEPVQKKSLQIPEHTRWKKSRQKHVKMQSTTRPPGARYILLCTGTQKDKDVPPDPRFWKPSRHSLKKKIHSKGVFGINYRTDRNLGKTEKKVKG